MPTTHTARSKILKKPGQRGADKVRAKGSKATRPAKPQARSRGEGSSTERSKRAVDGERKQTKQGACLALLRGPSGASIDELQKATGWQAHSVRGFLAGAVKKKLGLALTSDKDAGGVRRYRILSREA
jgi:uncharacterized protein DUF3489